jgi:KaiC/GvpD/RAD55 family RecA-like ATPase
MNTFAFGIPGLDEVFQGSRGIPRGRIPNGSVVLVRGMPGTGKTLLALQTLHAGRHYDPDSNAQLPPGKRTYLSCEAGLQAFAGYRSVFGWDTSYPPVDVDQQSISFQALDKDGMAIPLDVAKLDERARTVTEQIQKALTQECDLLAVDGLTFLQRHCVGGGPAESREDKVRNFTRVLFELFHERATVEAPYVTIVTAESHGDQEHGAVTCEEYLADIVIDLSLKKTVPGMRQRRAEVKKSRHVRQTLGEHSLWILGQKKLDTLKNFSLPEATKQTPGVFIFPRKSFDPESDLGGPLTEGKARLGFGIPGLDAMLGPASAGRTYDRDPAEFGLPEQSTAVILGPTGTGKTYLGLSFVLEGLRTWPQETEGDQTPPIGLVVSFDQSRRDIVRYGRNLFTGPPPATLTLAQAQENLRQCKKPSIAIHAVNPVNLDIEFFLDFLDKTLNSVNPSRVFIDSVSDVQRCIEHPDRFTDFLIHLFHVLRTTTAVVTYEVQTVTGQFETPETGISYLADTVIATRHIPINDRLRKAVFILKSRGSDFSNDVRELRIEEVQDGEQHVVVTRDLDLYADLLVGTPRPIEVFIKLFWENMAEKKFNDEIVANFTERFLNLKVSSFTKSDLQDVLEFGGEQAFEAPRSNVKVVSVDEYWIRSFAARSGGVTNSRTSAVLKDISGEIPAYDQEDFYYPLMRTARNQDFSKPPDPEEADRQKPLYAVPNYIDLGLFCYRTDILERCGLRPPISWDRDRSLASDPFHDIVSVWREVIKKGGAKEGLCGFAFEMSTPITLVTTFTEFVWNFGGHRNFMGRGDDAFALANKHAVTRALRFLHSLIHKHGQLLPFPCTLRDCARAVFSRHWYSTIQHLILDEQHGELAGKIGLSPFPTSRHFRTERNLRSLAEHARASLQGYEELLRNSEDTPENWVRFMKVQTDRLKERIHELDEYLEPRAGIDERRSVHGNSCSGVWYLAILESSKTHKLPAMLIREMVSPSRSLERALKGAGLPTRESFFRIYHGEPVPNLPPQWTFGRLYRDLLGRVRPRRIIVDPEKEADAPTSNPLRYDAVARIIYKAVMETLADETYARVYASFGKESDADADPSRDDVFKDVVEPLFAKVREMEKELPAQEENE